MTDQLAARIRTWWPLLIGHAATLLALWLAKTLGLTPAVSGVLEAALAEALGMVASALVWELGHGLERSSNPTLAGVGRWLISAGLQIGPPVYPGTQPVQPDGSE